MAQSRVKNILKSFLPKYQTLNLEYPVVMRPRFGHGKPPHPGLYEIINRNREIYKEWLVKVLSYRDSLFTIKDKMHSNSAIEPVWNNGFLPGLDIVMLYTVIASSNPSKYIEIGSGNSTKVVFKAKRDYSLATKIISIDPAPRIEIDKLADELVRQPLENIDLSLFADLKKGDVVFVDNSHRIFPNSDATVFFLEILPYLPEGVKVHLHDIYLPYDYPQDMCDRFYSEQYGLAFFLLSNPEKFKTIAPNYFISEDEEFKHLLTPFWEHASMPEVERHGGSYWLEIA